MDLGFGDGPDEVVPVGADLTVDRHGQRKQVVASSRESSQILSALRGGGVIDGGAGEPVGMACQACAGGWVRDGEVDEDRLGPEGVVAEEERSRCGDNVHAERVLARSLPALCERGAILNADGDTCVAEFSSDGSVKDPVVGDGAPARLAACEGVELRHLLVATVGVTHASHGVEGVMCT